MLLAAALSLAGGARASEPSDADADWQVWRGDVEVRFDRVEDQIGSLAANLGAVNAKLDQVIARLDRPPLEKLGAATPSTPPVAPTYTTRRVLRSFQVCRGGVCRIERRWVTERVPIDPNSSVTITGSTADKCACGCGLEGCDCGLAAAGEACPDCGRSDCPQWLASLGAMVGATTSQAVGEAPARFGAARFQGTALQFQRGQPLRNAGRAAWRAATAPLRLFCR